MCMALYYNIISILWEILLFNLIYINNMLYNGFEWTIFNTAQIVKAYKFFWVMCRVTSEHFKFTSFILKQCFQICMDSALLYVFIKMCKHNGRISSPVTIRFFTILYSIILVVAKKHNFKATSTNCARFILHKLRSKTYISISFINNIHTSVPYWG